MNNEWAPIETAPLSEGECNVFFIGMRVDRNGIQVCGTCYRNKYGAYEWWGGGLSPTHWMPLPSQPEDSK